MGTLYLVRHGQASLGAADYDQLSDLGRRQCARLGEWLRAHGIGFDAVFTGTLRRHAQSLAAIESALGGLPTAQARPGLDEYDSEAVIRAVHHGPLVPATTPEAARVHFRLLREGLAAWMAGRTQPQGLPTHAGFVAGIVAALDEVRTNHADGRTLVVSSGGPISHALGQVLGLAAEATIELNLQLRNSAVCELRVSPRRLSLVTFNALPHLSDPALASWVTHA
ncbi:MAG TPA: histidine phosphatase family protein [Burkholderiaceae bacterium]|nr:histidine phosphatase family protein [Burkholderiaceae bacterium]